MAGAAGELACQKKVPANGHVRDPTVPRQAKTSVNRQIRSES